MSGPPSADAYASLWIDGELVHLEGLVLHDANRDIRTPTHELTIARDVSRTSQLIAANLRAGPCREKGIRTLRQTSDMISVAAEVAESAGII